MSRLGKIWERAHDEYVYIQLIKVYTQAVDQVMCVFSQHYDCVLNRCTRNME